MSFMKARPALAAVCLIAAPVQAPVFAQVPDKFINLQVLPKDISREDLVATMRGMTAGLGVRCTHCHVESQDPEKIDFAADRKESKEIARAMLRMVQRINSEFVATLPAGDSGARERVTCYTCHRRSQKPPRPLQDLVVESVAARGVPAAIERYRQLRTEALDSGLYDFREHTLTIAARQLREQKRFDEAIALLTFNAELFPTSAAVQVSLGETAAAAGNLALARASYRKALELDPASATAREGLAKIHQER
jgi:tetratricopeptide (TPR) repeat protein